MANVSDQIDVDKIEDDEGDKSTTYTLPPDDFPRSGVSVGMGVDLGTAGKLEKLLNRITDPAIVTSLRNKLAQFDGKTGGEAQAANDDNPQTLEEDEQKALNDAVLQETLERIQRRYEQVRSGLDERGVPWEQLTRGQRTILFSIAHQHGNMRLDNNDDFKSLTLAAEGKWNEFDTELRNFYADNDDAPEALINRRIEDADYLQQEARDKILNEEKFNFLFASGKPRQSLVSRPDEPRPYGQASQAEALVNQTDEVVPPKPSNKKPRFLPADFGAGELRDLDEDPRNLQPDRRVGELIRSLNEETDNETQKGGAITADDDDEEFYDDMGAQMEFSGLVKDEEVDPMSGNEIPLGATAEGVRDDQTAAISAGEFVIPDYAVRYHGVDFYMKSLATAKAGLAQMEQMGMTGNPDDAVMSDEMPLPDMNEEVEDAPLLERPVDTEMFKGGFQTGGSVGFAPVQTFTQQPFGPQQSTTPLAPQQTAMVPQMQTPAVPMQAAAPAMAATQPFRPFSPQPLPPTYSPTIPAPTYTDYVGPGGGLPGGYGVQEYKNTETGASIFLTTIGGKLPPGVNVPPGYVTVEEYNTRIGDTEDVDKKASDAAREAEIERIKAQELADQRQEEERLEELEREAGRNFEANQKLEVLKAYEEGHKIVPDEFGMTEDGKLVTDAERIAALIRDRDANNQRALDIITSGGIARAIRAVGGEGLTALEKRRDEIIDRGIATGRTAAGRRLLPGYTEVVDEAGNPTGRVEFNPEEIATRIRGTGEGIRTTADGEINVRRDAAELRAQRQAFTEKQRLAQAKEDEARRLEELSQAERDAEEEEAKKRAEAAAAAEAEDLAETYGASLAAEEQARTKAQEEETEAAREAAQDFEDALAVGGLVKKKKQRPRTRKRNGTGLARRQ